MPIFTRKLLPLTWCLLASCTSLWAQDGVSLFDANQPLEAHWDGDPKFWKIEEGCITGQTTQENPTKGNTFLTWKDGELDDFELEAEFKMDGGNSGIQVRSFPVAGSPWVVGGYQADFDATNQFAGIIYGERFRGILAHRGTDAEVGADEKPVEKKRFAEDAALKSVHKPGEWNTVKVVCKGWTMTNIINGVKTAQVTDNDPKNRRRAGLLALQLHAGPPMKIQFRNIRLKRTPLEDMKKVVFFAGNPSHALREHEHRAGCMLLAKSLNESLGDKVLATVYKGGWPKDESALANADALVMYCDGGGGHPANRHLPEIDAKAKAGMGVGFIHYGVETIAGEPGDAFLRWTGGYFEPNWSVNPHWTANYANFPQHPVTTGVQPFSISDEWYYHMRFRPSMKGVTPILTDKPTAEATLKRADGPHSGNPAVRESVAKGEAQHMMWVSENDGGGRGFGFTGGHFHKNWRDDNFRKVVLNAITWISQTEVPAGGVASSSPDEAGLEANIDTEAKNKKK
jgi:type 1 glutamine amidotransferase